MTAIPASAVADLLSRLIRNACVNDGTADSGHEERSVATLQEYLGDQGLVFEPHPGRASVLFRVPGRSSAAPRLMLMGHTDVVPAPAGAWSHPPFAAVREGGFVWGRGAVDMLNVTAAMATVFRGVARGEIPGPAGDLLFLAVADEESAGTLGARWITDHHWDDVACEYLLTEVGAPPLPGTGGAAIPVTVAEKGPQWRRLTGRGVTGHGSQPHGSRNALVPVAAAVTRLAEMPMPVEITDEWRRFVEGWDPGPDLRRSLLEPDHLDDAIDRIAVDDPGLARWIHACTHLTVTPTVLRSGIKANVVPDHAEAQLDIRSLPGQDTESVLDHIRKAIGPALDEELELDEIATNAANASPSEGPFWDVLSAATEQMSPGSRLVPTLVPVATDARFWRARGTIAYGIGLYDDTHRFGDFLAMFHGPDERVTEASLALTADLLAAVVSHLA